MASVQLIPPVSDLYEMIEAFLQAPVYHLIFEVCLIVLIIKLVFSKSFAGAPETILTKKEEEGLIAEWTPDPLEQDVPPDHPVLQSLEKNLVTGPPGKYVEINGKKCVNMATLNFLGMSCRPEIVDAAVKTMRKYGVGSCGPRGFYGTMDVHLDLEEKFAKFMDCEESILYSYGFATIASAIPAYSKRGDVIFVDDGVCFAIQKGLVASRSAIKWFKHNDMEDLERLLKIQQEEDKKIPKKAKVTRRFLVVEGLYMNYADICPLPQLVALKWKYKLRLFMEESLSFGVLGANGKGVTEYYDISRDEVDLIAATLENSMGTCGGFCCGKKYVIDHQRLSGMGYCFSASLPPMLATVAIEALRTLEEDPSLLTKLSHNCQRVQEKLSRIPGIQVHGDPVAPIKHVRLEELNDDRSINVQTLEKIVDKARDLSVAITVSRYLESDEHITPSPSIRLSVNASLTDEEIDRSVELIGKACAAVLNSYS
ncbi:serine palmitoyltransferase 1-like isoform X2 [Mizuhopecten yessoensis]|uniref:Serine palmitoyltransferase 1 n=1 Tax=Mizuhopecten yessoensis TaxID=6573 RepID=A0A210QBU0_MIZYE|nr:serine palmitoyltransferase 1-like isoform X1 [Mizuhopecten yessoensis]XP_021362214.1 serine palmitoyltransferase 1-like isoform X2 [Mizuhopecten yessoensis]OWF46206.1 Serine palmitoyltransferase 1 [Mizuhopecten yessoensis]